MLKINRLSGVCSLFLILTCLFFLSCATTRVIREFHDPVHLNTSHILNKNIKVHMSDGSLYLLDSLLKNISSDTVWGFGSYYNQYREIVITNKNSEGLPIPPAFKIPLSSVALFETNDITGLKGKILAMTLVGIPTAVVSIYCIINPKACFGSCPTFYCWNGKDTVLMAEGFSSSILKSFEKEDIDMLYNAKLSGNTLRLRVTNEALETHVIRYANLLAIPRTPNERVFASDDGMFTRVSDIRNPSSCLAPEGDCLEAVREMDQKERYSETDGKNLAAKEFIEVNFNMVPDGELGLIIGSRQTFLTTYLFYQSLAYLGNSAGNFAAMIENGDKSLQKKVNRVWNILGDIEVFFQEESGKWIKAGSIDEMGPIASDIHLVRLPSTRQTSIRIKLGLTKGLWRIDYLALAKLGQSAEPMLIKPLVFSGDKENCDQFKKPLLSDPLDPLVTLPGDSFNLLYILPDARGEYELFLSTKGYYIEWMREQWLKEENLRKTSLFFVTPRLFMKMAAKEFKLVEPTMEKNFWMSRYAKKN